MKGNDLRTKFKEFVSKRLDNPYPINLPEDLEDKETAYQFLYLCQSLELLYKQEYQNRLAQALKELDKEFFHDKAIPNSSL